MPPERHKPLKPVRYVFSKSLRPRLRKFHLGQSNLLVRFGSTGTKVRWLASWWGWTMVGTQTNWIDPGSRILRRWQASKFGTAISIRTTIVSRRRLCRVLHFLCARLREESHPVIPYVLGTDACFLSNNADTNPLGLARRLHRRCAAVGQRGAEAGSPWDPRLIPPTGILRRNGNGPRGFAASNLPCGPTDCK